MQISLFNSDRECFLWTRKEIESIELWNTERDKFGNRIFQINNHTIKLVTANIADSYSKEGYNEEYLSEINVLIIYGALPKYENEEESYSYKLLHSIKKHPDKKFVIITKHPEDYWLDNSLMQSNFLLTNINHNYKNVRVIWDIDLPEYRPAFHFHPKMVFHHYHNNEAFSGGHVFENFRPVWKKLGKKNYRMGYHTNKVTVRLRKFLFDTFNSIDSPHLFFTNTSKFYHTPFDSTISNGVTSNINGSKGLWYVKQFVDMTVESDMEVVYETSTMGGPFNYLYKWTEKTIKLLMLGKPFIHTDPIAHILMSHFGMKPYESLYTKELWDYYNEFDISSIYHELKGLDVDRWFTLLEENINWLLTLSDEEWERRIEEANRVADINQAHYTELVYNTSLLPIITSANFWE